MTLKIEGEFIMEKVFAKAIKNGLDKTTQYLFAKCFEACPVGKKPTGATNLRGALLWDVDYKNLIGYIGYPINSEMENIAFYTEFGTGYRGFMGWKQYFEEEMPFFTMPIVPTRASIMHFVNENNKDVFIKKSKGQTPQAWVRKTLYKERRNAIKIWKNEFGEKNVVKYFNIKKKEGFGF